MAEYIEFLEGKKYPSKNADRAKNPDAFKDAGYILKEEELVVDVDVLDRPTLEKMIQYFNIKTQTVWTDRGAHFYFKKPNGFKGNKIVCPLGFEIEYKHLKNTPNGVTIKNNGKMREIDNAGIREDLPDIFRYKRGLKNLLGMEENEGRNRDIFAHRMRIQDLDRWKSILRFINNNVFAKPLDEKEFDTISRDGVKPRAEKNNQPEIAKYLIEKYRIVSYLGRFYWFLNSFYSDDEESINKIIAEEVPDQKTNFYKEIKNQFDYIAPVIEKDQSFDIKLQNGVLRNGKFYEIEYKDFTPYSIDIPYFKDATPVPVVDDYLDFISEGDESFKNRLVETFAHCFITNREFKSMLGKLFIFVGGGGNGKGTLLKLITTILGEANVSSLSIKQMADERYFASMFGKLANLGDDIEDEFISKDQVKLLKNISTCDRVQMRRLFENSKDVHLTCSLLFTSNHVLKAREKGESWKRRVDWIPIYARPAKKDARLLDKMKKPEALQYWLRLIIEAYKRLYENESFTYCASVERFNEEYHKMNNNVNEFLFDKEEIDFISLQKRQAYKIYKAWCEENEEQPLGAEKFHEEICNRFSLGLKRFDEKKNDGSGKRTTVWRYSKLA